MKKKYGNQINKKYTTYLINTISTTNFIICLHYNTYKLLMQTLQYLPIVWCLLQVIITFNLI